MKAFCAAPVHALVIAAALIEAGIEQRVVVVAGGSLGKLGMKFEGALAKGFPILEDVLAGLAVVLEPSDGSNGPVLRTDAVGRMPIDAGESPQAQLGALVGNPLDALGIGIADVDTYATELHNPEITEPRWRRRGRPQLPDARGARRAARRAHTRRHPGVRAGARLARVLADAGPHRVRDALASARPRAHARGRSAPTMLMAKGCLFLGRLTRLWDGVSVTLEA